jgi:hypothetical protein
VILSTRTMEPIYSSETSVLARSTRRHIPEDGIPHSRRNVSPVMYELLFISQKKTTDIHTYISN